MKESNDKEEKYNIKLHFYGEEIVFNVNNDYNNFKNNICKIFKISTEQFNSISLSYLDEDGDSIILKTSEDFSIFFQQVRQKLVSSMTAEINEDSQIDPKSLFDSALNYKEQIEQANNQINNESNIFNLNVNNNNQNNNYDFIDLDFSNTNQNIKDNEMEKKQPINNDVQIENIIFNHICKFCSIHPIIVV